MRPEGLKNPYIDNPLSGEWKLPSVLFEEGADAYKELLKKQGLYGESGVDFLISGKVKKGDKDWAEPFFSTLEGKGYLVFIEE